MPTKSSAVERPDLAQARSRFGLLLGSVYRQWRRQVDLGFREMGLTDATRAPLLQLYVHEQPLRQKDLASNLSLDTSSLVRVLAQLQEAGLIDCGSDPADRRSKSIALTDAGRATAARIVAKSIEIENVILADLAPDEVEVTRRTLQKIAQRFDALAAQAREPG
ncbi:MarR family winged helix-turn-helix transcriptional regulator [Piscinibacter koreensis]|uniref:MarR family transcriptional regulator n=1 Tax=Piscinibacter koreensis TaxID=2742824 RepID=A0A7Y6NNT1_9BURK|nr:MarR family transcriptional regulator [Schlegelella koreensis]NUZ06595.1 MarR family transcriptional regulator [Schlegelella koreensis]